MKQTLLFLVVLALLFGMASECRAQPTIDAQSGLADLIATLDKPSPILDSAKKFVAGALTEIHPTQKGAAPRSTILKTGQFAMWGDLFKTGDCFALAELTPQNEVSDVVGVILAEWRDGKWELRGLWKIPTMWRVKGWNASDDDYLPITPATQPFELRDLGDDGVPEVIIAGNVWKYWQEHFLLRFSEKTDGLELAASAMASPKLVDGYVRLYFDSGHRSIYEEWQFCRWKGSHLVTIASWHDETGYGQNDPTFSEGGRADRNGKFQVVRVGYGIEQEYYPDFYQLTKNGKPFGRMRIAWKDEKSRDSANSDEIEKAWLFEKITGLPRKLYPLGEGSSSIPRFEDFATVTIEGNVEAQELFSIASK